MQFALVHVLLCIWLFLCFHFFAIRALLNVSGAPTNEGTLLANTRQRESSACRQNTAPREGADGVVKRPSADVQATTKSPSQTEISREHLAGAPALLADAATAATARSGDGVSSSVAVVHSGKVAAQLFTEELRARQMGHAQHGGGEALSQDEAAVADAVCAHSASDAAEDNDGDVRDSDGWVM